MSAPANDNFASAFLISTSAGSMVATNEGATSQVGEPGNNGRTVWWAWTCPSTGVYYFTTDGASAGSISTAFKSIISAFTGTTVGGLIPVALDFDDSLGDGNGYAYGATIAFTAMNGTTYNIRVDTRDGGTGVIYFEWGVFSRTRLGSCAGCNFEFDSALCVSKATFGDATDADSLKASFGIFPPASGNYYIRYCGGAFEFFSGNFGSGGKSFFVSYINLSGILHTGDSDQGGFGSLTPFNSRFECEQSIVCEQSGIFIHYGGEIYLLLNIPSDLINIFGDLPITYFSVFEPPLVLIDPERPVRITPVNNLHHYQNSDANPSWQLLYQPFLISELSTANGFDIHGSGTNWTCGFNILNTSLFNFDSVTVELLPSGGVTEPSFPVIVSLTAGGNSSASFTFTADPTARLTTAMLQISRNNIVIGILQYPIYPIYSAQITSLNYFERTCGSAKYWATKITCTKIWPPNSMADWGSAGVPDPASGGLIANNVLTITAAQSPASTNMYNHSSINACAVVANIQQIFYSDTGLFSLIIDAGFEAGEQVREIGLNVSFAWNTGVIFNLPAANFNLKLPIA